MQFLRSSPFLAVKLWQEQAEPGKKTLNGILFKLIGGKNKGKGKIRRAILEKQ